MSAVSRPTPAPYSDKLLLDKVLTDYLKKWLKPPPEAPRFEADKVTLEKPVEYHAEVAYHRMLTPSTLELGIHLTNEETVPYLAGQYLNIVLPEDKANGLRRELRSYSLFSHPAEEGPLRLVAKLIPGGRSSDWLSKLTPSTALSFVAPIGNFHLRRPLHKALYFVATGTGIVPIRAMIRELIESGEISEHKVTLLWGLRTETDLFGRDELSTWEEQFSTFKSHICLSAADAAWSGREGRVTRYLNENPLAADNTQVYICGNGAMVDEVIEILAGQGLARRSGRVFCEKFFDSPRPLET